MQLFFIKNEVIMALIFFCNVLLFLQCSYSLLYNQRLAVLYCFPYFIRLRIINNKFAFPLDFSLR